MRLNRRGTDTDLRSSAVQPATISTKSPHLRGNECYKQTKVTIVNLLRLVPALLTAFAFNSPEISAQSPGTPASSAQPNSASTAAKASAAQDDDTAKVAERRRRFEAEKARIEAAGPLVFAFNNGHRALSGSGNRPHSLSQFRQHVCRGYPALWSVRRRRSQTYCCGELVDRRFFYRGVDHRRRRHACAHWQTNRENPSHRARRRPLQRSTHQRDQPERYDVGNH